MGPATREERGSPASFEWARKPRMRGRMSVEVSGPEGWKAELRPLPGPLLAWPAYDVVVAGRTWQLRRTGLRRRVCTLAEGSGAAPLAVLTRAGFRTSTLALPDGRDLAWRQGGLSGSRYTLRDARGGLVLSALNRGGPLRWRGTVRAWGDPASPPELVPLLVVFAVFVVLNSSELGLP